MDRMLALVIMKERLATGLTLGEDKQPVSDYDHYVHSGFLATQTAVEMMDECTTQTETIRQLRELVKFAVEDMKCLADIIRELNEDDDCCGLCAYDLPRPLECLWIRKNQMFQMGARRSRQRVRS